MSDPPPLLVLAMLHHLTPDQIAAIERANDIGRRCCEAIEQIGAQATAKSPARDAGEVQ